MTPTLFNITLPIGQLPAGKHFTYNGWGEGTVTHNDGHTYGATIAYSGRQVATLTGLTPGEEVTPT